MVFPYIINTNIPDAPNDPADDQPIMKQNYANIAGFLAVDHVAAGTNPGAGFHAKVTINNVAAPAAPIDPVSVMYTAAGTASTVADLRFRNANAIFPVSALRVCCLVQVVKGDPINTFYVPLNQFNVLTVEKTATGGLGDTYTVTFATNAVTTSSYIVSWASTNSKSIEYTQNAGSIDLKVSGTGTDKVSLLILQI
jgi:hypothetical protein